MAAGVYPAPLDSELGSVQVVRERRVIHVHDAREIRGSASAPRRAQISGYRTWIGVPMVAGSQALGTIAVARRERKPFSDQDIALLRHFARQAVIAIENVRLFTELGERNRELTDSLTQQTATSEILRVISSSPTDIQPVLDAVVESAARLCEAVDSQIFLLSGDMLREMAHRG